MAWPNKAAIKTRSAIVSGVIVGLKTTERGMNIAPPTAGPSAANNATMPIIGMKKVPVAHRDPLGK